MSKYGVPSRLKPIQGSGAFIMGTTGQQKRACATCANWITDRSRSKYCKEHRRKVPTSDFTRGYFCAVSVALREEGIVSAAVRSMFEQGGDPTLADPFDIELFREHGLMA